MPQTKEEKTAYAREWRRQNPDQYKAYKKLYYQNNKDKILERRAQRYIDERWTIMAADAKIFARKHNLAYDLDADYIKSIWPIDNKCPIFGTEFASKGSMGHRNQAASLDKIIPSKGYVRGNVQIISYRANRIKSDASVDELGLVYEYMKNLIERN